MYVRALTFECRDEVGKDDIKAVYADLIEIASSRTGYRGSVLMMGEDRCRGMALVFWEDRDSASAASQTLLELLRGRIHEVLVHPPEIVGYDVIDSRLKGVASE